MAKRRRIRRRARSKRSNPLSRKAKVAIAVGAVGTTLALGYGIYHRQVGKSKLRGCGEKYRNIVVTTSGYTLENPYGAVAFSSDYEEWRDLARRLSVQANERFNMLGEIECEATGGVLCESEAFAQGGAYPRWNALVELNNRMTERYEQLPNAYTTNPVVGISMSQAVIFDALCLMQRSDEGIRFYGGTVPETPGVTPGEAPGFLGRMFPSLNFEIPWYVWGGVAAVGLASGAALAYGVSGRLKKPSAEKNPDVTDLPVVNPDEVAA